MNIGALLKSFGHAASVFLPSRPRTRTGDDYLVQQSAETWAYVCGTYAAYAVAQVPVRIYATTRDSQKAPRVRHVPAAPRIAAKVPDAQVDELVEHPLTELLAQPNPRQSWFEFIAETQMFLDTTGDAFWLLRRNMLGVPQVMLLLPPSAVKIDTDRRTGRIKAYEVRRQGREPARIAPRNIVHFRNPNPRDSLYGMGCLEAASRASQLLTAMTEMELALNDNLAMPPMIVKYTKGTLLDKVRREVEERWNKALQGIGKAGRVKVMDQDFDVQTLGLSPREMAYLQGRKWSREEIAAAYRVPISLVTVESVNRSNADAALRQFARFGVATRIKLLESTLNRFLVPQYDEPRLLLAFDSPVPEDREFSLKKLEFAAAQALMNDDELRTRLEAIG